MVSTILEFLLQTRKPTRTGVTRMPTWFLFCFSTLLLLAPVFSSIALANAPEVVTLTLPEGESIKFRAIYLGLNGNKVFDAKEISLGPDPQPDESGRSEAPSYKECPKARSYKEYRVDTLLGGGFVGQRNGRPDGQPDWLYYLGETEVTESQWSKVMRWYAKTHEEYQAPKATDSRLPRTKVTVAEIQLFIEALNEWLLSNQREQLPFYRNNASVGNKAKALAFARLPTEAEWEFAARGGAFNKTHPYGKELNRHEWYKQSGGELMEVKVNRPNPLGLYDMLGNVEEITQSLFGPDYQQGRFGGYVVRGANYASDISDVAAHTRGELLMFNSEGRPYSLSTIGFRLALSTRITSGGFTSKNLDDAWQEYVCSGHRSRNRPGPSGSSSPTAQAEQDQFTDLQREIERLAADNQRLSRDLSSLQKTQNERATDALGSSNQAIFELEETNKRMREQIKHLRDGLAQRPHQRDYDRLTGQLSSAEAESQRLSAEIRRLKEQAGQQSLSRSDQLEELKVCSDNLSRTEQQIASLKTQIGSGPSRREIDRLAAQTARLRSENDALEDRLIEAEGRRAALERQYGEARTLVDNQTRQLAEKDRRIAAIQQGAALKQFRSTENLSRIRTNEMRYLKAEMQLASYNAFNAILELPKLALLASDVGENHRAYKRKFALAERYTNDYLRHLRLIVNDTEQELFPEVKAELLRTFQADRGRAVDRRQILTLDHIEEDVGDLRRGLIVGARDVWKRFDQRKSSYR